MYSIAKRRHCIARRYFAEKSNGKARRSRGDAPTGGVKAEHVRAKQWHCGAGICYAEAKHGSAQQGHGGETMGNGTAGIVNAGA